MHGSSADGKKLVAAGLCRLSRPWDLEKVGRQGRAGAGGPTFEDAKSLSKETWIACARVCVCMCVWH